MSLRLLQFFGSRNDAPLSPCDAPEMVHRFAPIRGIVFDMGDVLFDATLWRRQLLQLLGRLGLQANYRAFFDIWDRDYLDAVHRGLRDYGEAFTAFLRDAGLSPSQIDETVAASNVIKRRVEADVRPFPTVAATLQRLRAAGLRLAVLSDSESPAAMLAERLGRLGIGSSFAEIVSSVEIGASKPDPLGYRTVLTRLSLRPEQTAFVGHDADELNGARRCGMRTIAFNYEPRAVADCRLRRFDDLLRLFADGRDDHATPRKAA